MKKRFREERIIRILKEHEAGKKAADIVREYNVFGIQEGCCGFPSQVVNSRLEFTHLSPSFNRR